MSYQVGEYTLHTDQKVTRAIKKAGANTELIVAMYAEMGGLVTNKKGDTLTAESFIKDGEYVVVKEKAVKKATKKK